MTLADVRMMCVVPFTLSSTRHVIMDGLETVVDRLLVDGIEGELWIDGSFLTEKIDPEDADVVMVVDSGYLATATAGQQATLDWLGTNLRSSHHCDSYLLVSYPLGHASAGFGEWMRSYWIRQFGFSRGLDLKGMPTVKVP
jgi:hypothetical protein